MVVYAKPGEPRNPEAKAHNDRLLCPEAALPVKQRNPKVVKKVILFPMRQKAKHCYKPMKQQKCEAIERRAGAVTEPLGPAAVA